MNKMPNAKARRKTLTGLSSVTFVRVGHKHVR